MKMEKILYVEDEAMKFQAVTKELRKHLHCHIDREKNAEDGIDTAVREAGKGAPYDLIILDMHFDFFGDKCMDAGERTMEKLRERSIETPVIFCSSQNWKVEGSIGNIYYNPNRNWESEAGRLIDELKAL